MSCSGFSTFSTGVSFRINKFKNTQQKKCLPNKVLDKVLRHTIPTEFMIRKALVLKKTIKWPLKNLDFFPSPGPK